MSHEQNFFKLIPSIFINESCGNTESPFFIKDTCPRESSSAWLSFLRRDHPTFLFRSATAFLPAALESSNPIQVTRTPKSSHRKDDALGSEAILTQLAEWAGEKTDGTALNVAVVGLTNVSCALFFHYRRHCH